MQREFTAIPSNWSVGQTIDYLRENKDLPEEFLEIFIINEEFKPIGTVPSSKVLTTSRETKMVSIMSESQLLIPVDMDKEEVGNVFENYNLNSAAVVDKTNKLVGMIMYDDILTVLKEEAEEDGQELGRAVRNQAEEEGQGEAQSGEYLSRDAGYDARERKAGCRDGERVVDAVSHGAVPRVGGGRRDGDGGGGRGHVRG